MGIPSPFVSNAPSPLLRSRGTTPLLLQKVDELSEVDFLGEGFELTPPALHLEESLPSSLRASPLVSCVRAPRPGPPGSPFWPATPPSLDELVEKNTFLNFNDATDFPTEELCVRRRALSDFAGMQMARSVVAMDELCLPDSESCVAVEGTPEQVWHQHAPCEQEQEWHAYAKCDRDQEWQSFAQCDEEQEWHEYSPCELMENVAWSDSDHHPFSSSTMELPLPPPAPGDKEVYKPFWPYGSSWPFNCAPTTLALQNLPNGLTQLGLTQVLDNEGFAGLYDFVFLPHDLRTGKSKRYALVNCLRHSYGLSLAAHFHRRTSWGIGGGGAVCKVKWSFPQQGLQALVQEYRDHVTMHPSVPDELRPAMYHEGWQVPLPPPTKYIQAPRFYKMQDRAEIPTNGQEDGPWQEASGYKMHKHEGGQSDESSGSHFHFESSHEWPAL